MNYYNEFDLHAATWLNELIENKLIPQGEVDVRSVKDVTADDLRGYKQCHFFAGIGGWSLALKLAGWPEDKPVWTGSCPCQAFSNAGKKKGSEDERDLWPVFFNLVKACHPERVFGEQVEAAIRHGWLDRVCADMEKEDYAVGAIVLGAHSVGAPHIRQRLYWGAARMAENSASLGWRGWDNGDTGRQGREIQAQGLGNDGGLADSGCERCEELGISNEQRTEVPEVVRSNTVERVSDAEHERNIGMGNSALSEDTRQCELDKYVSVPTDSLSGLSPHADFGLVYCRDNKVRRIPAESLFLSVVDGVSEGVDAIRNSGVLEAERGFPLCKKEAVEGRVMLLKGYGNAIVPVDASFFIKAFEEVI